MGHTPASVLILYFSGTGNTHFAAKKLSEHLNKHGIRCDIAPFELGKFDTIKNYDLLILGFPVYAYSMPEFMKNSINKLQKPKTGAVYIFSTYALHPGNALRKSAKLLKNSGFIPIGYGKVKMPGSDGMLFLKKESPYIKKSKKIISSGFNSIEKIAIDIKEIVKEKLPNLHRGSSGINSNELEIIPPISLPSIFIEALIIPIFKIIERKAKKRFYADEKCNRCGICEKICPSKNITVTKEKVIFDGRCYLCLRCIHQCPQEAIQIGKATVGKYRYRGPFQDFNPLKILSN